VSVRPKPRARFALDAKFPVAIAAAIGIVAGLILLAAGLRYQHGRSRPRS
jgi:hypothetical protein